jgi:hypothetical protein
MQGIDESRARTWREEQTVTVEADRVEVVLAVKK